MNNEIVHVGAEYFILRKSKKGYSQKRIYKRKVKELQKKIVKVPNRIYRHFESKKYLEGGYKNTLSILTTEQTLDLLEKEKFSFLRYGDGEIAIINGNPIPFQEYNETLAKRLMDLLSVDERGIKIGIPYYYFTPVPELNDFTKKFARALSSQRKILVKRCKKSISYIDTVITQVYQTYETYDFDSYYKRMQDLLKGKDVTVICGDGVFERIQSNALDVCNSVDYIYAPSMNAFSKYSEILNKAMQIEKNRLICIVLGPTAKVLAYDLYKAGYVAWDMGHYFKDYDAYCKKSPRTAEEITRFYQPD